MHYGYDGSPSSAIPGKGMLGPVIYLGMNFHTMCTALVTLDRVRSRGAVMASRHREKSFLGVSRASLPS